MTSKDTLVRKSDNKVFKVTYLAHWSAIESLDGKEADNVKWYGVDATGDLYVSADKGHTYVRESKS